MKTIENLRSLAILAAVVESGSFRGAGQTLGLSASVVSHHISNLEKRLECAIFKRTSRKLQLTEKGVVLHRAAREMVDVVNGGLTALSGVGQTVSGTLRIGAPQFLSSPKFLNSLDSFLGTYPGVNLDLHMTATIDTAQDGDFDVLITRCQNTDSSFFAVRLSDLAMSAVAAPDLAAKVKSMQLKEVAEKTPLILAPGFTQLDWETAFSNALVGKVRIETFRANCDYLELAHEMACSGMGVVVLPRHRMNVDLNSGRLVEVLPELGLESRPLYAVCSLAVEKTSLARRFMDHIVLEYEVTSLIEQIRKTS